MENEKRIIRYVLAALETMDYSKLVFRLETLLDVLDGIPSYCAEEVIKAVCKVPEDGLEEKEAPEDAADV